MNSSVPFLNHPAPGWKHDLPGPSEPPSVKPESGYLANIPNNIEDVYLELSTSTLRGRGVITWVGIFMLLVSLLPLQVIGSFSELYFSMSDLLLCVIGTLGGIWGGMFMIRTDVSMPRDEPIRFNRARRKVYAYHFIRDLKRPFSPSAWGVRIASYDRDDLHAEACETYGPMGTGGFSQSVMLSVRNQVPETSLSDSFSPIIFTKVKNTGPSRNSSCNKVRRLCPNSSIHHENVTAKHLPSTCSGDLHLKWLGPPTST